MGRPGQAQQTQFERTLATARRDAEMAAWKASTKPSHTFAEVAEHFGISLNGAVVAVHRAISAAAAEGGRVALDDELAKLDAMEEVAWGVLYANHIYVADGRVVRDKDNGNATVTDHKPVLMAIDRLIRISERRARLLGLDAPTKQHVTVITEDVVDAELRRLEQELADRGEPVQP